ncbi:MAG: heme-binding protein [Hyphomonadaceae bacterium]|nr:heme-binding protein [Hyphomonadaceae bacterium]
MRSEVSRTALADDGGVASQAWPLQRQGSRTAYLDAEGGTIGLATRGEAVFAFYDPPWTLPLLRRNEVMIEIAPHD